MTPPCHRLSDRIAFYHYWIALKPLNCEIWNGSPIVSFSIHLFVELNELRKLNKSNKFGQFDKFDKLIKFNGIWSLIPKLIRRKSLDGI